MKAAQISEYGDVSVVNVVDIEKPVAGEGQVLVEVHASSLNPFDTTVRSGNAQSWAPLQLPATLGGDIAGEVVSVGAGVDSFKTGDKVYGQASAVAGNSGAFAEFAATKADQIALAPSNADFTEAAALPLVGVSALQALTEHINLQAGQKLFINGGAGGIGEIAIQIAKSIGAYVATTATGEGIEAVKALGADEVIDYTSQDFTEVLSSFNAVFDTVGGDLFTKSLAILKSGGVAVSMIAQADEAVVNELGVTAISQFTQVTTAKLDKLRELVESGAIKPHVGRVYVLDEVQDAFTARESDTVSGKIVLEVKK